jgi:hypothetical protein
VSLEARARDIFVRQVTARLSKRQCSTSEPFKSHQAQVPPEGITHKLAPCPTGLLAESVKELFEIRVQPNGEGTSHIVSYDVPRMVTRDNMPSNYARKRWAL